ncbi:hypothetical protein [Methylomonas rosea]|uniref:hypothetical protein n=1 Tax=Methylomonas rosea TaxID=2952227 RepID=UPI0035327011
MLAAVIQQHLSLTTTPLAAILPTNNSIDKRRPATQCTKTAPRQATGPANRNISGLLQDLNAPRSKHRSPAA